MAIIAIEFSVAGGIFMHTREDRARGGKRETDGRKRARSKFHFNPEIPRHIMATLLSLSFRFPLPLSPFISSSGFFFFRDMSRCEQLRMRATRKRAEREQDEDERRYGNTAAAYTCICYCDMDVNRLGGLRRMWGESRFR